MPELSEEERIVGMLALQDDLEVYAASCLKIKDKDAKLIPFVFNRAQRYIHERLEKQKAETGMVRALLLKGRQQGGSTYIAGRFYQKVTMTGQNAFIMAHEDKATTNLFNMAKRYQDHNILAPSTKASNAQELLFSELDCGYKLATAGSKDVGRSNTVQLFHGSEAAFWKNPELHMAGIGNTIADNPGTEIILESTANGIGNHFHKLWQDAEAGKSNYIAIFVPWYWQPEYRAPVPENFERTDKEREMADAYGLDDAQLQWRRNKTTSYGAGMEWLVDQEYPNCAADAFRNSTGNPLINPGIVSRAANSEYRERNGPLIIGCDPAGDGVGPHDRSAIAFRQGRTCFRLEWMPSDKSPMQIAGRLAEIWNTFQPDAIIIDKGGLGAGIYDRLVELNIPVIGVNNAERARNDEIYENRRAEMWWLMQEWFADAPCRIPNDAALIADICAPQPDVHSSGRKLLESKKNMAKRGIRSPDGGDALALTFAEPVAKRVDELNAYRTGTSYKPATSAGY